jgi:hypothetical protein
MPEQNNTDQMAIPASPKTLAAKIIKTDPARFVMGKTAQGGLKKFGDKHPVNVTGAPNMSEKENADLFNGGNVSKDKSREADRDDDEKVYESTLKNKILEKYMTKALATLDEGDMMAPTPSSASMSGSGGDAGKSTGDTEKAPSNNEKDEPSNDDDQSARTF